MILSHDLGTTGDKATLVDADARVVAAVTVRYGVDFGHGGKAEQDADAWWRALCEATRLLLEQVPSATVDVVSFSGQMMGAVLLDDAGDPVRPAIIWADTRATRQAQDLVDRIGMAEGYAITGHRLNPTYSLAKVMWVRDTEPEVFARTRHVLLAKDYMVYRLTGVLATDPSDASSTNAFDQRSGAWSTDILAAAGVDPGLLPEVVPSTHVAGGVSAEGAAASGLPVGTPVVMGGGDGPMAALGCGIVDASSGAYASLGSSSWVSFASDAPLLDPQMRTMTFNHVVPGRYVPTATMQAGGASLQWIVDVLSPDRPDRFERLLDAAAGVEASAEGLFFLPYLLGERSPYWDPRARAVFAGLAMHHERSHLVRAVLEGVAFNLYTGLGAFLDTGAAIDRMRVVGGAARSPGFVSILSDVWDVPVVPVTLVDEATSLGAAVVGGVGVGIFREFDLLSRFGEQEAVVMPDAERHARYRVAHRRFEDAYRRLETWFDPG